MTKPGKNYDVLKRGIDIVGSGVGLIVLAPVLAAVGIVVRAKLGSPVIFRQNRPGKDGRIFTLYKFRSMLDVDESKGLVSNEDRMTQFGSKLRATSLDELPSLVNVLKGDMSLVGPRPLMTRYLGHYTPQQARRHEVRPGIAGLAQVNGRNDLDWHERLALDIEYVDNRSLVLDIKLLVRTLAVAMQRDGIATTGYAVGVPFDVDLQLAEASESRSRNTEEGVRNV